MLLRLEKWIEKMKFAVFDDFVGFMHKYIHHLMCVLNKVANVLLRSYFLEKMLLFLENWS